MDFFIFRFGIKFLGVFVNNCLKEVGIGGKEERWIGTFLFYFVYFICFFSIMRIERFLFSCCRSLIIFRRKFFVFLFF